VKKIAGDNSYLFILIFCSCLSAFGPFLTDLYLPALPLMTTALAASASFVQLSLTVALIGLGLGQLILGPLSDKYGRKPPLLLSLALLAVSSAGCSLAWNIQSLIVFRFIQGFSSAGGVVMSRSIAADLFEGKKLASVLSVIVAIMGIAPVCAPLIGGLVLRFFTWRGVFVVILLLGVVILGASFAFQESLVAEKRRQESVRSRFAFYRELVKHRRFMLYVLALGFGFGGLFFSYLSASPFIFQQVYKLSPQEYSALFAFNSFAMIGGAQLSRAFKKSENAVRFSSTVTPFLSIIIAALLYCAAPFWAVEAGFFFLLLALNMLNPAATALALNLERENSGSASALVGFVQFLIGGLASPLMGLGNVMISCGIALVGCSCVTFVLVRLAARRCDKAE
jgi:DHA1 family bicyclomycin/chloramphenicol resistance-like MFS transporter